MRSCSSPENSPSSLISPSTAIVRVPGACTCASVFSAAAIESGLAL